MNYHKQYEIYINLTGSNIHLDLVSLESMMYPIVRVYLKMSNLICCNHFLSLDHKISSPVRGTGQTTTPYPARFKVI